MIVEYLTKRCALVPQDARNLQWDAYSGMWFMPPCHWWGRMRVAAWVVVVCDTSLNRRTARYF
jgi:hypothetical protein